MPFSIRVQTEDMVEIFGGIYYHRCIAALSGKARSAASQKCRRMNLRQAATASIMSSTVLGRTKPIGTCL